MIVLLPMVNIKGIIISAPYFVPIETSSGHWVSFSLVEYLIKSAKLVNCLLFAVHYKHIPMFV